MRDVAMSHFRDMLTILVKTTLLSVPITIPWQKVLPIPILVLLH